MYSLFKEFNMNGNFTFFIFKLHSFIDGIIRIDLLTHVNAKIP